MTFRQGETVNNFGSVGEQLSADYFLSLGLGTPSRVVTGEFSTLDPAQMAMLLQSFLPFVQNRAEMQPASLAAMEEFAIQTATGEGGSGQLGRSAYQDVLANSGERFDQYYEQNIRDPLVEDFVKNIRPATSRRFADSGFFSSQREQADERDMENLMKALVRGKSETALAAQQQQIQAAAGLGNFEQMMGNLLASASTLSGQEFERLVQAFVEATGVQTKENVAIPIPGQIGGMNEVGKSFMGGFGSGLGSSVGCWVAEALYGPIDERTYRIRAFVHRHLMDASPLGAFCRLYFALGQRWASLVRARPDVRAKALSLWNGLYRLAEVEDA